MSKMAKEASNVGKAVFDIGKWLLKSVRSAAALQA